MELRHLRYFVAAADECHVGRAAARLNIAQPALSRQIQALEAELGLVLFERKPHGLKLTAAGREYYQEAIAILTKVQDAANRAQRAEKGELGILRLACSINSPWNGVISKALLSYRRLHPDVEVEIVLTHSHAHHDALRSNQVDLGFVFDVYRDERSFSYLDVETIGVALALPEGHALAPQPHVTIADCGGEDLLTFRRSQSPKIYDLILRPYLSGQLAIRSLREMDDQRDVLALVSMGLGIAFVTTAANWWRPMGVAVRPIADHQLSLRYLAAWRTGDLSPPAAAFVDLLRKTANNSNNC